MNSLALPVLLFILQIIATVIHAQVNLNCSADSAIEVYTAKVNTKNQLLLSAPKCYKLPAPIAAKTKSCIYRSGACFSNEYVRGFQSVSSPYAIKLLCCKPVGLCSFGGCSAQINKTLGINKVNYFYGSSASPPSTTLTYYGATNLQFKGYSGKWHALYKQNCKWQTCTTTTKKTTTTTKKPTTKPASSTVKPCIADFDYSAPCTSNADCCNNCCADFGTCCSPGTCAC